MAGGTHLSNQLRVRQTTEPLEQRDAGEIAGRLKALGGVSRLRILSLITSAGKDGAAVVDLTVATGLSQPTVSHHLRILREAGLIATKKRGVYAYSTINPWGIAALAGTVRSFAKTPRRRKDD